MTAPRPVGIVDGKEVPMLNADSLDYELTIRESQLHLRIDEPNFKADLKLGNRATLDAFLRKIIPGDKYDHFAPVIVAQIEARGDLTLASGGKFKTA